MCHILEIYVVFQRVLKRYFRKACTNHTYSLSKCTEFTLIKRDKSIMLLQLLNYRTSLLLFRNTSQLLNTLLMQRIVYSLINNRRKMFKIACAQNSSTVCRVRLDFASIAQSSFFCSVAKKNLFKCSSSSEFIQLLTPFCKCFFYVREISIRRDATMNENKNNYPKHYSKWFAFGVINLFKTTKKKLSMCTFAYSKCLRKLNCNYFCM